LIGVAVLAGALRNVDHIHNTIVIAVERTLVGDAVAVGIWARSSCDIAAVRLQVSVAVRETLARLTNAVVIAVSLIRIRGRRAVVNAVETTIAIAIDIRHTAATDAGRCLGWIARATIVAVGYAIAITIGIRHAAATGAGRCLGWIARATIVAVGYAIAITIGIRHAAATGAGRCLGWIARATIVAVGYAIAITIGIRHTAATGAGRCLGWIVRATIAWVDDAIAITIDLAGIWNRV
jgi:hypothetical protein